MKTDWDLVRDMMSAAIDACERIEAAGCNEQDRDAIVRVHGQDVSVRDFLTSAWVYPETIRYTIIRQRHDEGSDLAYVPGTARILTAMAQAAAEIIGSGSTEPPAMDDIRKMILWFRSHAAPGIEKAIAERRAGLS
jgi:hypothetical protein